jgi:ribonuclease P protein component
VSKLQTLKSKKEFQSVFDTKLYLHLDRFIVNYDIHIAENLSQTDSEEKILSCENTIFNSYKFGFIITKKTGNAVVRNKIRRRLKEVISSVIVKNRYSKNVPRGTFIFMARKSQTEFSYNSILKDILYLADFLNSSR